MFVIQVSERRHKSLKIELLLIAIYFIVFLIFIDNKIYVMPMLFLLFFPYVYACLIYKRIIFFDDTGCTIKCGLFKKHYLWTEVVCCKYYCFSTKSKIKENNRPSTNDSHGIEIFFKRKKRPDKVKPLHYLERNPFCFSYIFVTFPYKPTMYKRDYIRIRETNIHYYFVDEQELFVQKLKEWGVTIDGIEQMYIPTWDK